MILNRGIWYTSISITEFFSQTIKRPVDLQRSKSQFYPPRKPQDLRKSVTGILVKLVVNVIQILLFGKLFA